MELTAIPIEGKYILYRPLLRRAFVGNRAMVDLVRQLAGQGYATGASSPNDAMAFLERIGFLAPDPPPPPPPDTVYRPTMAVLLLTNRCNLCCTYCYADGGSGHPQDVPFDVARLCIDQVCQNALDMGHPRFDLGFHGGGEPVQVWETLQQISAYARSKELPCHLAMVSNGVWTARQLDWILHNLDSINISFDGDQATQNRQRPFASGQGSFRAVMHTLKALDRSDFAYAIRMTATAPWREQLAEDVRFICEETGCAAIQVEPAFNTRRGEHQGPTREEGESFVDGFMEALKIAKQAGRHLTYSGARPWLLAQAFCTAPYGALIVNPEGNLVACYEVVNRKHPLAQEFTVGRVTGSGVVLNEPARKRLFARIEEKRTGCRDCFCYWHCAGDCYPRTWAAKAKDPTNPNPRCFVNQQITIQTLLWYIMAGDGVWQGRDEHPQEKQLMEAF
jgi:uncharacterized protein